MEEQKTCPYCGRDFVNKDGKWDNLHNMKLHVDACKIEKGKKEAEQKNINKREGGMLNWFKPNKKSKDRSSSMLLVTIIT